jgi:hypothetical protein
MCLAWLCVHSGTLSEALLFLTAKLKSLRQRAKIIYNFYIG